MAGGVFEVRAYDETLLVFELSTVDTIESCHILWSSDQSPIAPLDLTMTDAGLEKWLSVRAMPLNRRFADRLCLAMEISPNDTNRIIEVSQGLSLNDPYWVTREGSPLRFDDVNLFENGFDDLLAAVAMTGHIESPGSHGLTPELTTGGSLAKAWRIAQDGTRELWKGSTPGYAPGEWISEALASQVAHAMGIDCVRYDARPWISTSKAPAEMRIPCSVCANFCSRNISYTPFASATGICDLPHAVAFAMGLGEDQFERLADMLVLDALLVNTDRHYGNFGIMRDMGSGRILGFAPVFDNGRSLFPNVDDTSDLGPVVRYSTPAIGRMTFDEMAARVMGERQLAMLERVASTLELDSASVDLAPGASSRCADVANFVRNRAAELVGIPPVSRDLLAEACAKLAAIEKA